jgi:hypothetical protein
MKIFRPMPAKEHELCQPLHDEDFDRVAAQIRGRAPGGTWSPIDMGLIRADEGRPLKPSDAPWFEADVLVFKSSAVQAMGELLRKHGELLALGCKDESVVLFNATTVLPALDEAAAQIHRLPSGHPIRVVTHVFHADVVSGNDIFKIDTFLSSPVYVGEGFVEEWTRAKLRGLEFEEVWDSAR